MRSGGSYLSSSDLRVHFGLGAATQVDRLEPRRPGGQTDVASGVPADRIVVVKEGQGVVEARPFRKATEVTAHTESKKKAR